ncbi:hypothetical protein COLO4_35733 [Corchorus olitorius]|uniref:Uncharacterized protein n=1 Tax=Corchorus olitorius TaxID=93759 RepID=A0A1R3GDN2_9ROSI|nr:hypothetical protein COLO4_35733 [Corchorus olitorius]
MERLRGGLKLERETLRRMDDTWRCMRGERSDFGGEVVFFAGVFLFERFFVG